MEDPRSTFDPEIDPENDGAASGCVSPRLPG